MRGNRFGSNLIFTMVVLFLFSAFYPIPLWAAEGAKKWEFPAEGTVGEIHSSPAIGPDGTIYIGSDDGKVYAVQPDGTKKWEFETGGIVSSSPAIGYFGGILRIYVGSEDNKVYAINADGTAATGEWPFVTGGPVISSPAIGTDGTIFVGSGNAKLYAIKSDGTQSWDFSGTSSPMSSSPAIGSDTTIYVGSDDWKLYAIKSDGTKKWEFITGGKVYSSPTIGFGGDIYVGSEDGKLYAIESSSARLVDKEAAWPKFQHDVRNTARNNTNVGPTADAGSDQTVKSGNTVALNGSNSADPDYGIPLYAWTQTKGTSVTLSDSAAVKPNFTAPGVDGDNKTLIFQLEVTDNGGETDTDTITITVEKKDDDDKGCFISTARGE